MGPSDYFLLQVNNKGLVLFEDISSRDYTYSFVFPFGAHVDTTSAGQVFYRIVNDSAVLNSTTNRVKVAFFDQYPDFKPTLVFIATWYQVGYYNAHSIPVSDDSLDHFINLSNPFDCYSSIDTCIHTHDTPTYTHMYNINTHIHAHNPHTCYALDIEQHLPSSPPHKWNTFIFDLHLPSHRHPVDYFR